jgi:uncharacterized protein (DUF427 family)
MEEHDMETRERRTPGPDHPITIEPTSRRFVVRVEGRVVADSTATLTLKESTYPPVQYFPLADVDETLLVPSPTSTYCPFKGDASYFSIAGPHGQIDDAIWTYAEPFPAVAQIGGYLAFYVDRVDVASPGPSTEAG